MEEKVEKEKEKEKRNNFYTYYPKIVIIIIWACISFLKWIIKGGCSGQK